jgi:hypothetical protein
MDWTVEEFEFDSRSRQDMFLFFTHTVETQTRNPPNFLHDGNRLFLRVIWRGREAHRSLASTFEIKNYEATRYIPTSPYTFMERCLIKHRKTIIFHLLNKN